MCSAFSNDKKRGLMGGMCFNSSRVAVKCRCLMLISHPLALIIMVGLVRGPLKPLSLEMMPMMAFNTRRNRRTFKETQAASSNQWVETTHVSTSSSAITKTHTDQCKTTKQVPPQTGKIGTFHAKEAFPYSRRSK